MKSQSKSKLIILEPSFWQTTKQQVERTKHVDIRYHFTREMIEEGFIKIDLMRIELIFSQAGELFTKHTAIFSMKNTELKMIQLTCLQILSELKMNI